jgi:ribosome maturation factor RimP
MSRVNETIVEAITNIARRVGDSEGIEVVEVQLKGGGGRRMLRIVIDKPEGVTHADCENISVQVGTILDVEDVVPGGAYTLEVSSPGLDRKLTRPQDYERFLGRTAKFVLREPVNNQRHWEGKLREFASGVVTIEVPTGKATPPKPVQFSLAQVEKANLKFEW